MADINYLNPTAVRPDNNWQPPEGLAGVLYSQDRARYDSLAGLQDIMARIEAAKAQEDFTKGMPVRQAERDAKLRDLPTTSRGLEATTRGQELNTGYQEAMQPGKIGLGMGEQGLAQGQQNIAKVIQAIAQVPPGPDYSARLSEVIARSGATKEMLQKDPSLQHILNTTDPKEAATRANAFLQQQSTVDPAYRMTMDKTRMSGDYDLERQRIANQGAVQAAQIRSSAKNKSAVDMLKQAKDPVQAITAAMAVINDPDIDPQIRQSAVQIYNANLPAYQRMMQRNVQPQIPGFPQMPGVQMPGYGQEQQPQQQQYQPGQTYKGRTGTYKYKGGDPKNPQSWDKVE